VSVNLALVLQRLGGRIGLVDADVLGPSIPACGIPTGRPLAHADGKAIRGTTRRQNNVNGHVTGDDTPAVLRGPMVVSTCAC